MCSKNSPAKKGVAQAPVWEKLSGAEGTSVVLLRELQAKTTTSRTLLPAHSRQLPSCNHHLLLFYVRVPTRLEHCFCTHLPSLRCLQGGRSGHLPRRPQQPLLVPGISTSSIRGPPPHTPQSTSHSRPQQLQRALLAQARHICGTRYQRRQQAPSHLHAPPPLRVLATLQATTRTVNPTV